MVSFSVSIQGAPAIRRAGFMMVPVLMYHHISPVSGPHTVSPEVFRDHLRLLAEQNIRTLSLSEFEAWRAGELALSQPAVLLTFDDAWLDNWVHALPVLQEFESKAVFFVVTSWPGDSVPRWDLQGSDCWQQPSHVASMALSGTPEGDAVSMRWSELLAARDTGLVDLASHSHRHGSWWEQGATWEDKLFLLEEDLAATRDELQKRTGGCSPSFCWPKGQFSNEMVRLARDYGFSTQFSTLRGGNGMGTSRLVRRINVENKPASWLEKRLMIYRNPVLGRALGLLHQQLHGARMTKLVASAPRNEFRFPLLSPV